jgi:hypothetical protein
MPDPLDDEKRRYGKSLLDALIFDEARRREQMRTSPLFALCELLGHEIGIWTVASTTNVTVHACACGYRWYAS